jgi:tRNA(Ile)-lysidine synthase
MLSLAERVDRTILRYSLLPPDARVVVALSGGADSTALACLLVDLAAHRGFRVVAAAHFNHRLRGAASEADEEFCAALAGRLGLAWRSGRGDVRALAASEGRSTEDAARRLRYAFLADVARELGATRVATGHTRDDQAETVLLQLFRGAGPRGLRGMAFERELESSPAEANGSVRLVRPLLEVSHADLVAWLHARGQSFREDASNQDRRFLRNRVRHEVIPFLRDRLSRSVVEVLARNAEIAAADWALLDRLSRDAYGRVAVPGGGDSILLDREALLAEPEAIGRRVVLLAFGNLRGSRFVGKDQAERVLRLAAGTLRGPISVPGARVAMNPDGSAVELSVGTGRKFPLGMNFSPRELSIPGETRLPGYVLSSSLRRWNGGADLARLRAAGAGRTEAIVDAARLSGLSVRTRRPGDWIRPLGLGGRKKLQDYFVDRKVPRETRDSIPLVVDERDRIVWVAGHGIDEEFRVSEATRDVVILKLRGEIA